MVNELVPCVFVALKSIGQSIESRLQDEEGQTLAEYGLIMAVIAVVVVVAAGVAFRGAIIGAFNSATTCLNRASSSTGCT